MSLPTARIDELIVSADRQEALASACSVRHILEMYYCRESLSLLEAMQRHIESGGECGEQVATAFAQLPRRDQCLERDLKLAVQAVRDVLAWSDPAWAKNQAHLSAVEAAYALEMRSRRDARDRLWQLQRGA